ncbi:hypothetical protein [Cellulomonas persica]|uniref:Uncharacterized protein n=1 Tax=Cellulomonas persica TaxID=76861 RepID=A0A510UTT0_9CELL|nr:hypothetical protein [Cellulomonas persica]GEK17896.1 hypothetical protein CPE01_16290 [Cellulomonas persica]
MRKRVITAAVGVVGLVVIGLGVASATVWRADDVLVATTTATTHVVVTDPGVLELGGDPATVRVTAPDGDVVAVVGRDTDVDGWVGTDPYTRVTGLASWDALATTAGEPPTAPSPGGATPDPAATGTPAATAPATAAATTAPTTAPSAAPTGEATAGAEPPAEAPAQVSPAGNDNWVAEATGTRSAELVWPAQGGRWSLLAVSTGTSEPTLEISWPRVVTTPWLWPCVVVGALLVLGAAFVLLRSRTGDRQGTWESVHTGAVPAVADEGRPLTRRELREAAQAARGRTPTGSLPRVTGAHQTVPPHDEGRHSSSAAAAAGSSSALPTLPASVSGPTPAGDGTDATVTTGATPTLGAGTPLSRRAMRRSGTPPTATVPAVPGSGSPASAAPSSGTDLRSTATTAPGAAPGAARSSSPAPGAASPVTPSAPAPGAPASTGARTGAPRTGAAPTSPSPRGAAPTGAGTTDAAATPGAPTSGTTSGARSAWSRGPAAPAPDATGGASATSSSTTPPHPAGPGAAPAAGAGDAAGTGPAAARPPRRGGRDVRPPRAHPTVVARLGGLDRRVGPPGCDDPDPGAPGGRLGAPQPGRLDP